MPATVRLVDGEELLTTDYPLRAYAFHASPGQVVPDRWRETLPHEQGVRRTHIVEDGGRTMATASVWEMTQNVRGVLLPMGGVAGVATHPGGRRRGYARRLVDHVLRDMRDQGQVVSALFPFRASFYERFGYVGMPQQRRASLDPRTLVPLLRADAHGELYLSPVAEVAAEIGSFLAEMRGTVHGMAVRADPGQRQLAALGDRWALLARRNGAPVGFLAYEIKDFAGELYAHWFLHRDPAARTLLLGWLARHADQVCTVSVPLRPEEAPETWLTDADLTIGSRTAPMSAPAPMVRVLSVPGLAGLPVGPGRLAVRVTDDLIGGVYTLSSVDGQLAVESGGEPTAELTGHGLAALVYGILDPAELVLRGYGTPPADAADQLRALFPRRAPFLFEQF